MFSFDELNGTKLGKELRSKPPIPSPVMNESPPVQDHRPTQGLQQERSNPPEVHTSIFNLYSSTKVSQPINDQSLQSWFKADFLEPNRGNISNIQNTSLMLETDPSGSEDDHKLQGWFNSELNNGMQYQEGRPMNGLSSMDTFDTPASDENVLEQARISSLTEAVVLLRSLTEDQWVCFDLGVDKQNIVDDGSSSSSPDASLSAPSDNNDIRIVDLLAEILTEDIIHGGKPLTSTDFNYSLARMAIATDVAPDDILALMMQTHSQMNELAKAGFRQSEPNSITHEILLLVLVRRFSAFHNAIELAVALSKDPQFKWSPKTLQAASELCERKDLLRMSRDLTKIARTFDITRLKIPKRVFISLINVYKDNDARSDAIDILKIGLKVFLKLLLYEW